MARLVVTGRRNPKSFSCGIRNCPVKSRIFNKIQIYMYFAVGDSMNRANVN
jgi:hypothetical protein